MPTASSPLGRAIAPGQSLLVDTSVLLAYLDGSELTSALATELVDGFAATGRNRIAVSAVTVAELLVRPFRTGPDEVALIESFIGHFADLEVRDVAYPVAREAARIRASTSLSMPDAMIVGTAVANGADTIVTNDGTWPPRLRPVLPDLRIVVLSALTRRSPSRHR